MFNLFDVNISQPSKEFLILRDNKDYLKQKQFYEDAWKIFEPYADRRFPEEFARHTYNRLWEMYLGVHLLKSFKLESPKPHGPDFHIRQDNHNIWIEATVSTEGTSLDAVPSPFIEDPNRFGKIPEDKIILRYTNSVTEKFKKYNSYLKEGIISANDIFIIAINGADIGFEILNPSPFRPIVKALFGIDEETITLDNKTLKPIERNLTFRNSVKKLSGEEVSTALFLDPQYSGISGVLYSDIELWNPIENLHNGFMFIHNYQGRDNNLETGWLKNCKYCWLEPNLYREQQF